MMRLNIPDFETKIGSQLRWKGLIESYLEWRYFQSRPPRTDELWLKEMVDEYEI